MLYANAVCPVASFAICFIARSDIWSSPCDSPEIMPLSMSFIIACAAIKAKSVTGVMGFTRNASASKAQMPKRSDWSPSQLIILSRASGILADNQLRTLSIMLSFVAPSIIRASPKTTLPDLIASFPSSVFALKCR